MGMLLRRRIRIPDYMPQVNGKYIKQEPRERNLTDNKKPAMNTTSPKISTVGQNK